ncbi:Protein of unknown function [Propionibacterium freudenreichii]|nr:Protein of unknown function [Propionibacterium freudenreichii]
MFSHRIAVSRFA